MPGVSPAALEQERTSLRARRAVARQGLRAGAPVGGMARTERRPTPVLPRVATILVNPDRQRVNCKHSGLGLSYR